MNDRMTHRCNAPCEDCPDQWRCFGAPEPVVCDPDEYEDWKRAELSAAEWSADFERGEIEGSE